MSLSRTLKGIAFALIASLPLSLCATATAQQAQRYTLATATPGGTYHPVGVALATLVDAMVEPSYGISLRAVTSAGSADNLRMLREGWAQFAILQGLYGCRKVEGVGQRGVEGPGDNLRAITMLWRNVEHIGIRAEYAETGTVDDLAGLKGKRLSIGKRGSGTEGSGRTILTNLGLDPDADFALTHMGYGDTARAIVDGKVDAFNLPAGPPVSAITHALAKAGDRYRILDFTDEQIERANGGLPLWSRHVIPSGTYPGQWRPINTMAQPNLLVVNAEVDEATVYVITRAIFEHLDFLHGAHPATETLAIEHAIDGLPVALHPGAIRYFEEQGMEIPARLRSERGE